MAIPSAIAINSSSSPQSSEKDWSAAATISHALSLCLTAMTLAILSLILLAACAVLAGDTVRLDSLIRQCSFMVDGIKFDLCPILGQQQEKGGWWLRNEKETPPTVTYNSYRLSLDGALRRNASIPEDRQVRRFAQGCLNVQLMGAT